MPRPTVPIAYIDKYSHNYESLCQHPDNPQKLGPLCHHWPKFPVWVSPGVAYSGIDIGDHTDTIMKRPWCDIVDTWFLIHNSSLYRITHFCNLETSQPHELSSSHNSRGKPLERNSHKLPSCSILTTTKMSAPTEPPKSWTFYSAVSNTSEAKGIAHSRIGGGPSYGALRKIRMPQNAIVKRVMA